MDNVILHLVFGWILIASLTNLTVSSKLLFYYEQEDMGILNSGLGVRQGNGVVLDTGKSSVWVTQRDGSLQIFSIPSDIDKTFKKVHFRPTILTNRITKCHSSVSLYENDDGVVEYSVYAVVDFPQSVEGIAVSRVLALSSSGEQLWEAILEGIVNGTPQISNDGNKIYVTHNVKRNLSGNYTDGRLSMIRHKNGIKSGTDLDADGALVEIQNHQVPFGPLTISTSNKELIYFGEAWDEGSARFGFLYESDGVHLRLLSRTSWNTAAAPTLSTDGKSMWMVGSGSSVHGWVDSNPFYKIPSWSVWLGTNNQAIVSSPIVTPDEGLVFVLTANGVVFCLKASTGETVWSYKKRVMKFQAIQLAPDGLSLYAVGNDNHGTITKFEAASGQISFEISCLDLFNASNCTLFVEGSFDISRDGGAIFLGSIHGDIVGISIDTMEHIPSSPLPSPKPPLPNFPTPAIFEPIPSPNLNEQSELPIALDHLLRRPSAYPSSGAITNTPSSNMSSQPILSPLSQMPHMEIPSKPTTIVDKMPVVMLSLEPTSETSISSPPSSVLLHPSNSSPILENSSLEIDQKPTHEFNKAPVIKLSPALSLALPVSWSIDTIDEYVDDNNEVLRENAPVDIIPDDLSNVPSLAPAPASVTHVSLPFEPINEEFEAPYSSTLKPYSTGKPLKELIPNTSTTAATVTTDYVLVATGAKPSFKYTQHNATFNPKIFKIDLHSMMKKTDEQSSADNISGVVLTFGLGIFSILALGIILGRLWQYDRESSHWIQLNESTIATSQAESNL